MLRTSPGYSMVCMKLKSLFLIGFVKSINDNNNYSIKFYIKIGHTLKSTLKGTLKL